MYLKKKLTINIRSIKKLKINKQKKILKMIKILIKKIKVNKNNNKKLSNLKEEGKKVKLRIYDIFNIGIYRLLYIQKILNKFNYIFKIYFINL